MDQLKQRLIEVWFGLQQTVVDETNDERKKVSGPVPVKGCQLEDLL